MLIDVDNFKAFNDTYGHPEGDHCLKNVAATISRSLRRPADICARYGGEEFAVVLPNTSREGALLLAETMRQAVAELNIAHAGSASGRVTISIGVATDISGFDQSSLFKLADEALYRAKHSGRNQVAISPLPNELELPV